MVSKNKQTTQLKTTTEQQQKQYSSSVDVVSALLKSNLWIFLFYMVVTKDKFLVSLTI